MRLAIDTNAYQAFMKNDPHVVHAIQRAEEICLPVPVLAELRYGFRNGTRGKQNEANLVKFLDSSRVKVYDCDEQTTFFFAELFFQLKSAGTPIPLNDVWIASIVWQHRLTLLTFDTDFKRIPQISLFNFE